MKETKKENENNYLFFQEMLCLWEKRIKNKKAKNLSLERDVKMIEALEELLTEFELIMFEDNSSK